MTSPGGSAKPLSQKALRLLVTDLAGKIDRLEQEVERLRLDNSNLRASNQALKDEIARLKNLPPRPPFKPSGMEKATQPRPAGPGRRPGDVEHPAGANWRSELCPGCNPNAATGAFHQPYTLGDKAKKCFRI